MADPANATYLERNPVVCDLSGESRSGGRAGARSDAAVELTGIAHRLGYRWALRGVSLRVDPGEVVAVVGPNGSGKTTLLRVLATTIRPARGSGSVFGRDLHRQVDGVRALTGMLGHGTGLYDDLTAAENLAFALRMCGEVATPAAVDGALDAVGMRGHAADVVRGLSSGMRRRVALARLVLRRPRLLLLDEPYNAFDADGVRLVDALVRDTAAAGGAALVVTHDLGRGGVERYDRVVAMAAGRVTDRAPSAREAVQ